MAEEKTDLERFLALYESFGIELETEQKENGEQWVWLREEEHEKFDGYSYFYSRVIFDAKGQFVEQHFYGS